MTSTKDVYWLAGLLEGEGAFTKNGAHPVIALKMDDLDVVSRCGRILGASNVRSAIDRSRLGRKCYFVVSISGCRAAGWMMTLYSLMGARRQARIRELLALWLALQARPGRNPFNVRRSLPARSGKQIEYVH